MRSAEGFGGGEKARRVLVSAGAPSAAQPAADSGSPAPGKTLHDSRELSGRVPSRVYAMARYGHTLRYQPQSEERDCCDEHHRSRRRGSPHPRGPCPPRHADAHHRPRGLDLGRGLRHSVTLDAGSRRPRRTRDRLEARLHIARDAPTDGDQLAQLRPPDRCHAADPRQRVAGTLTQPRVEPEVGLRFLHDVPTDADRAAVLACVDSAHACLEVVDSVWADYRFKLEDNTADGSSAAGVVLGPPMPLGSIETVEVSLWVDGVSAGRGLGSDASGHPADGVVWLVAQLATRGIRLRAGDVVITGGLTRAAPLSPGTTIEARFSPGDFRVAIRRL